MELIILNIVGLVIVGFLALLPTLFANTIFEDSKYEGLAVLMTFIISVFAGLWLQVTINLQNII